LGRCRCRHGSDGDHGRVLPPGGDRQHTDVGTNQQFVIHVFEMDTTFNDEDVMWQAIGNSGIQNFAYTLIIIWAVLIAAVLI
jgi:predicted small integral membrane protein